MPEVSSSVALVQQNQHASLNENRNTPERLGQEIFPVEGARTETGPSWHPTRFVLAEMDTGFVALYAHLEQTTMASAADLKRVLPGTLSLAARGAYFDHCQRSFC